MAIGMLRSMLIPIATCIVGVYLWGETGLFIGMAIAPFVAYVLTVAYVYIRHGKENYPLLISSREAAVKNFCYEFEINAENVVSVRDKIEEDLKACDVGQKSILLAIGYDINKLHHKIAAERTGTHLFELKKAS